LAYIGQRPVIGRYIKLDQISSGFNGSNTGFSMTAGSQAVFPGTARNLLLSLGGVIQEPDTDFTISGSTLTFTTPPVANTTFFGVIYGDMQATGTPSDGTVLPASIASSGHFKIPQLTVNEDGADVDFRVEGDTEVNLLFVDASADKVGIGTSSPNARLVVYRKTVNASNPVLEVRSDHDTTNSIKFSIDGDGEAFFSDNVGIGTTSPTGLLHLKSSSAETILKIESESADDAMVFIDTSDGTGANADVRFARDGSTKGRISFLNAGSTQGDMRFTTGSDDEAMRIDSSGNVGIGTTSPATILHVKANVGDMLRLDRNNTGSVGNQIAFRHSNSGTFQETGSINCVSTANAGAGQLRFSTRESGGSNTEKMRIEDDGKVGIGTTSPAVRLEVEDTISATFSADNSITAANQLLKLENLGSNSFAGMHFRTAGGGDGHFGTFQNTSSANDCTFYFSNQIDSGGGQLLATLDSQTGDFIVNKGKVGIGETSPAHKLHISAAESTTIAYFDTDLGGRGLKINTFVSGNAASAGVEFEAPAGANKSAFVFKGASEFMRLNASGNLGIGTSSPALLGGDGGRVLHLAGSANPEIVLERTTSGTEAKASMRITDTEDLRFAVKDGSASTIDALSIDSTTGNVGIGVTDVKAALQVNSSKNAETDRHDGSNYHLFLRNPADDAGEACGLAFSVTSNATKTGAAIMHEREGGGSLGSLQFYTNSDGNSVSERVRITSDGKLLVGTTSGSNFSSNVAEFVNATQDAAVGVRSGTGVNGQDFITFKFGGGPTACGGIRRDGTTQGPELFSNSDRRIKTNILDMDNVLDKINQLSLKKFDFKDGTGSGIGLIAQDLISIFPSKVKKDDSDDGTGDTVPDGVSAWTIGNNFTYEILKAIQELSAKVEALEAA